MLINIDHALTALITAANKRKIVDTVAECKKSFESSFVRAGEKKKVPAKQLKHGQLSCANDWKLLIDYDHRQYVFHPPFIPDTNERPDVVIWAMSLGDFARTDCPC